MAKRRRHSEERRRAKKAAKEAGLKPKGKSRYAKRRAQRMNGVAEKPRPHVWCARCARSLARGCACGTEAFEREVTRATKSDRDAEDYRRAA